MSEAMSIGTELAAGLIGRSVSVRVPATSANLGPGYDSAGLALDLFDELEATVLAASKLRIEIEGEGADSLARDSNHLVVRSLARGLADFGIQTSGLQLKCINRIPHGRGLGSSSAAIVGGLGLAKQLLAGIGLKLSEQRLLELANDIEGHPDNVAPAIFGGFTIAWQGLGLDQSSELALREVGLSSHLVHPAVQPVIAVPTSELATERARELLPTKVPLADAAQNSAAAALLSLALTSQPDLLFEGTADRIHQHYRRFAYPDSYSLVQFLRQNQVPAAISGAGPTVIAFGVSDTDLDAGAVAGLMREQIGRFAGSGVDFEVISLGVAETGLIATSR